MSVLPTSGPLSDRTRRRLAWAAPVVVAGVVSASVMLADAASSNAAPNLPKRTVAQLLAAVQGSDVTAFSGVVEERANLGLPSLPDTGHASASLSWQTFITGTHKAKVWVDGPDKQRLALIGELSEADVVHNGPDVWTYTSDTNTVTHSVLPQRAHEGTGPTGTTPADTTPSAVATRVLKAIDPTTKVSVDSSRTVAGRAAYTLVIRPRDARSTVHKVTIAIDATKSVPLQVQVFGSGSSPAFETGFSSISFRTPAASTFAFRPPKGATTSTDPFGPPRRHGPGHPRPAGHPASAPTGPRSAHPGPTVIGRGWTAVVELPAGAGAAGLGLGGGTLHDLTSAVGTDGTRLLHTALVNAVLLPDGRTFVGAVNPALLEHIAATTPN